MSDEATPDAGSEGGSTGPGIGLPRPKGGRLLGDPPPHRDKPRRVIGEAPSRIAPSPGRLLGERRRFSERPRRLFGETPEHEEAPDRLFGATPEHQAAPERLIAERDVIRRIAIPTPEEMSTGLGGDGRPTTGDQPRTAAEHMPPRAEETTGVASSLTGRADATVRDRAAQRAVRDDAEQRAAGDRAAQRAAAPASRRTEGATSRPPAAMADVEALFQRAWMALRDGGVPEQVANAATGTGMGVAQRGASVDEALEMTIEQVRAAAREAGWPDTAVDVVADRVRRAARGEPVTSSWTEPEAPRPAVHERPSPRSSGGGPPPRRARRSGPGFGRIVVLLVVGVFVASRVLGGGSGDRAPEPTAAPEPVEAGTGPDGHGTDLAVEAASCSDRMGDAAGGWPKHITMADFPSLSAAGGGVVTVASYAGELVVLDAGTGAAALCVEAFDDEIVILEAPRRVGDGVVWVTSDPEGHGRVHGADLATGDVWSYGLAAGEWADISDDLVVVSSPLRSLDPRDGSERWRHDLDGAATVAGDLIMMRGDGDEVVGLDGNGTERWRAERGVGFGQLTVTDEAIIRTDSFVVEVRDPGDGSLRWSEELAESGLEVWGVVDDVLVCHRYGTAVVGVDLASGAVRWERPIETDGHARRIAAGSGVVVIEESGSSVVVDVADGSSRWEVDSWTGVLDDDTLLVIGDHGTQLVRLDLLDGEQMGATATDARVDLLLGDMEAGLFGLSYGDGGVVTVWPLTVP